MTVLRRIRAAEGYTPILVAPPPPDALLRFWHELSGHVWTGRLQDLHPLTNLNYVWHKETGIARMEEGRAA